MDSHETKTAMKSRMFQPSLKYALGVKKEPRATILITISNVKREVRTQSA